MRIHLHEKDATNHRRLMIHNELKDVQDSAHLASISNRLKTAEKEHEAADDTALCSFCSSPIPFGQHVSIAIECILVPGAAVPLVKDYPASHRPHFYTCFDCALKHGVVTQKELDTGRRE